MLSINFDLAGVHVGQTGRQKQIQARDLQLQQQGATQSGLTYGYGNTWAALGVHCT